MCERLVLEPQLYPPACPECPPQSQKIFWRTYTYGTPHTFGDTSAIDLSEAKVDSRGYVIVDKNKVERPGVIWASSDLAMSMSVGITRSVMESVDCVRLAGFNFCGHDSTYGVKAFNVISSGPVFIMAEIRPGEDHNDNIFSEGIVFTALSPHQLGGACHYEVNPQFTQAVRLRIDDFQDTELITRFKVYSELRTAFEEYFGEDIDRMLQMLRDGVIVQSGMKNTVIPEKILEIFSSNMKSFLAQSRRLQEYRVLGGDPHFQALIDESLRLLGKSENASPEWAIFYEKRRDEIADELEKWKDMIRW